MNLEQRVTALERVLGKGNFITSTVQNLAAKFNGRFALANRTALPSTCTIGELAVLNGVQYICSATDTWTVSGGGTPGGSDTQIQFNDGGAFGGNANFSYIIADNAVEFATDGTIRGLSSSGIGKYVDIVGGDGATDYAAGWVRLLGGTGVGNAAGGTIELSGGTGAGTEAGGDVNITAGEGGATSGNGGDVSIRSGTGGGTGDGGSVSIGGGNAGVSGANGGDVTIFGGAENSGNRGNVNINTGALATTTSGGFLVVPKCAGAPTGTPAASAALIYDTTNNKLYVYNGAWKSVTLT